MTKSLKEMQAEVTANCKDKGWYDEPRTFAEGIALMHSEVSEALEAWRMWKAEDATPHEYPWGSQPDPDYGPYMPKPEGIGSELADVLIRVLDECERQGIDLEFEYERKMTYNRTRPYKHGGKTL